MSTSAVTLLNPLPDYFQIDIQGVQNPGSGALNLNETKQQMPGADVVMPEALGFFLCQNHHTPGGEIKFVEHRSFTLRIPLGTRVWFVCSGNGVSLT